MNPVELERKLIAVARANPPSDRVPYAFEKRVMEHLKDRPVSDALAHWSRALWRAAAPCVAVTVLLAAWSLLEPAVPPASDLAQAFDATILAAADQDSAPDSTW